MSELATLLDLIHANGTEMLKVCEETNQSWPSVHTPYVPSQEQIRRNKRIQQPVNLVLAAARQLVAALEEPNLIIKKTSFSVCQRL
jgi:hypothetical protein